MKVSKSIYKILFIIAGAMAATACSDEQYEINKVEEGLPASVTLSLSVPSALETTMTRATADQETDVEKVAFLFYKKNQPSERPIVVEVNNLEKLTKITETNYLYTDITISKEGLTSGNWYLYAVANYGRNGITLTDLETKTKAGIDELCTTENQITDITETAVLMSGKYGTNGSLTLEAGSNTLDIIKLKRLVAKSTFKIQANSGITFTLQSCELRKCPYSSTLMEREGWEGTNPGGSLSYKGNPDVHIKDTINITNFLKTKDGADSLFFYTQENVQKANPYSGEFTYNMREERKGTNTNEEDDEDDEDDFETKYNTFKYAPTDATYVVIKGIYDGPRTTKPDSGTNTDKVTGKVTYTIHLGDFSESSSNPSGTGSYDNFSIRRNVKYNYTVTITGVNSIIVEAQTKPESGNTNFQHGAEGDIIKKNEETAITVDAHYETVMLKLPTDLKGKQYALSVKTPIKSGIYRRDDINKSFSIPSGADINWIEFGKPESSKSFKPYKKNELCDITQLLTELEQGKDNHILEKNDTIYVTAYINEYYYEGEDISKFVNADDREMTLAESMSVSPDGHSTYTETPIFSIKQRSIKSCFELDKCPNPFGIETIEELEMKKLKDETQYSVYSDKWYIGFSNEDKERNGYKNTCATYDGIIGKKWDTFINQAHNGYFFSQKSNRYEMPSNKEIMQSGYDDELGSYYSSDYSIYQFLIRNRDLNGNGIIDEGEIRWYIPAHEQCLELWYGENSLPAEARLNTQRRNYLTSTPGVSRTWWADEGSSFGAWKSDSSDYDGFNAVRVVRSLKTYNAETTPVATCENNVVTINYLADANIRTTSMIGNYVAHMKGDEADKLPRKFKIASFYLTDTIHHGYGKDDEYKDMFPASHVAKNSSTIGNAYYEISSSEKGKWRVPNEKELGLMLQSIKDLKTLTGGRTRYQKDKDYDRYYYVQDTGGKFITTNDGEVKSNTPLYVRLVRDVVE